MNAINPILADIHAELDDDGYSDAPAASNRPGNLATKVAELPIATKVKLVFGTFVVFFVLTVAVAGIGMADIYKRYQASTSLTDALTKSIDLRSKMGEVRYHAVRYILVQEKTSVDRIQTTLNEARQQVSQIRSDVAPHNTKLADEFGTITASLTAYGTTFDDLRMSLAGSGRSAKSQQLSVELASSGEAIYAQARAFEQELEAFRTVDEEQGIAQFLNLVSVVSVLTIIAFVLLLGGAGLLTRDLKGNLAGIVSGMTKLAKGDRHFEIEGAHRKDEIGEMVRALLIFQKANTRMELWAKERVERSASDAQALEDRERERQDQRTERGKLLNGLASKFEQTVGEIVGGVASASSQLKSTAGSMAVAADQSSTQSNSVAKYMNEVSTGVTAAAAASDEFAMSIGEISRQAASSAELARKASYAANEADTTISKLTLSAEEVGQIVDMIHSIAKRTNLLALNASIEAARGGEAGRGFAVVASEVKELAAQTSRATEDVSQRIRAIQESTSNSVQALRIVGSQIGQLETTAISIASAVDQQSVAGQDLARSIDLAARSTDEVSSSVDEVRETALATGAAASQVLNSATELERQSSTLHEHVSAFLQHVRQGSSA